MLEKKVVQAQADLDSAQKAFNEAGLQGSEYEYETGNLRNGLALSFVYADEKTKAHVKTRLAEQEL